ncbi:lasso peptide biosynthesis B2 protein [Dyadobacter sp. CY261]|nr:lasso peptide biosynthesis B2 protein [Dyadobacter sp. CY261]
MSVSEKILFLKASLCLSLIKFGLAVFPFNLFRKIFHWLTAARRVKEMPQAEIGRIVWAVDTAANLLPFELLCLPRALAAKYMLRKVPAVTLEIGIEINPAKHFEAHAWIERNGSIVIGQWPTTVSYRRLWVWE